MAAIAVNAVREPWEVERSLACPDLLVLVWGEGLCRVADRDPSDEDDITSAQLALGMHDRVDPDLASAFEDGEYATVVTADQLDTAIRAGS